VGLVDALAALHRLERVEPRESVGSFCDRRLAVFSFVGLAKASTHELRRPRPITRARRATRHIGIIRSRPESSGEAEHRRTQGRNIVALSAPSAPDPARRIRVAFRSRGRERWRGARDRVVDCCPIRALAAHSDSRLDVHTRPDVLLEQIREADPTHLDDASSSVWCTESLAAVAGETDSRAAVRGCALDANHRSGVDEALPSILAESRH